MPKTRKCAYCGKVFTTNNGMQKYCSEECAEQAKETKKKIQRDFLRAVEPVMELQQQEYLTFSKAAILLGCTRQYVYKLVEQGKLPTSRLLEATGQQAYYRHVGGIVIVEELAEPLQPSSLAVVHRQQRYCQPAGQVDHAVGGTVEDEKGDGIE